jgi:hypothetical protein
MARIRLTYEYNVAGRAYHSEQIRPSSISYRAEESVIQSFARRHQEGTVIQIHYDSVQPAKAVILPGPDWIRSGFLLPLGPLIFLFGCFGFKQR